MATKENLIKNNGLVNKEVLKEERQEIKQLILKLTEQRVDNRFSDKQLDRENEKIKLRSGLEITIKGYKAFISEFLQIYSPMFPKDFYREINRLNNWNIPESELYLKPPIVGKFTNEFIYGRYPKEILPKLQSLNPYIRMGYRSVKHFQWLNETGKKQLEVIIKEAILVMKESNDWHEFTIKYGSKYGLPFQTSLF
jgi:hypothetical protein